MIECRSCKAPISPKAQACPKCGHPNTPTFVETLGRFIKVCFFGTIALVGIVWFLSKDGPNEPPMESEGMRDRRLILASEAAVRSRLKDGSGAQFRNVSVVVPKGGKPAFVVCGEVNSKNGFGGMAGFQSFIAAGSNPDLVFIEEMVKDFATSWNQLCVPTPEQPL